ncbi:MAG: uncharacterized protein K0S79_2497 [Nitrospira sp.]|jgi:predicted DsbA family dithiol-disulfide isomerase|nr:uncharacterized protein [Nitrospira sp.]
MEARRLYRLFSDFNCPFCYALHERLHTLNLIEQCEWHGVEHAPYLPSPMKPWQGSLGAELRHEVMLVRRLEPDLPIALPPGKPNTRAAIERAIASLQDSRARGMRFIREAYRAFWYEGRDLSDRQVLDDLAGDFSILEPADQLRRRAKEWETAWQTTGQAGVPMIVSVEGNLLTGCVPTEDLVEFFGGKIR